MPTDSSAPARDDIRTMPAAAPGSAMSWWLAMAIGLTAVCAMSGNRVDTDLWGHVQYGREVLRDGRLPETTTWSYVTEGYRWINHENLAELALAWTVDHFGPVGLTLGKLLLACVIVGGMLASSRGSGAGWVATAIVTVLAADAMEFHWHFRPQAITYTCFALLIAGLDWVFRDWRGDRRPLGAVLRGDACDVPPAAVRRLKWLLLLVPLFLVWTNGHGGFAVGIAVLFAYLGLRGLEACAWWGRSAIGVLARLAGFAGLAAAATLLNPYGTDLHAWLVYDIGNERPEISDWRPLDLWRDQEAAGLWLLVALWGLGLVGTQRRRDLTQLVILAITLWQGIAHCRNLVFFAILCGCWLARDLHDVLARWGDDFRNRVDVSSAARVTPDSHARGWARLGPVLAAAWMLVLVVQLVPRLTVIPVRRDWYPISAMQYIADRGLQGRMLVDFNWAQYAIMCIAENPRMAATSRVAVDGRLRTCYPWETLDIYLDFFLGNGGPERRNRSRMSPPFQADRALEIGPPDLVLVWREQRPSVQVMESAGPAWVLLYQDQLAQLWGRSDRYDNPASRDYVPTWQRQITETPQVGSVPWPALPRLDDAGVTRLAGR